MGHDEETNNFNGGTTPVTPNPRAQFTSGNRLGMRPSRNLSAADELNRIVAAENQENATVNGGDIVLAPAAKQPKDKKVYIAIALGIITIAVFVIGFLMKSGGLNGIIGGTSAEASDFTKWLLNGDGSVATTTEKSNAEIKIADFANDQNKLIYPLNFYNVSTYATRRDENIEKYFTTLNQKYEVLKAEKANTDKKEDVEKLGELLELLENSVNYTKISRELATEYSNGANAAKSFYKNKFDKKMSDDRYSSILNTQARFFEDQFTEMSIYKKAGCYDDKNGADFNCIINKNDADLINQINNANGDVLRDFAQMSSNGIIKTFNEEIIKLVKSISEK